MPALYSDHLESLLASASTPTDHMDILRYIHKHDLRYPQTVLSIGKPIIDSNGKGYPLNTRQGELWDITEQVAIAAMDVGDISTASQCVKTLFIKFPQSQRALRLAAMLYESKGEFGKAIEQYDLSLESDPLDAKTWKRKVSALYASKASLEALDELLKYLKIFPLDVEAWKYLKHIALSLNNIPLASSALEEVMLHEPQNYLVHLEYADLLYTADAKGNAETARKYYCQAVELNPGNLRALLGILLCIQVGGKPSRLVSALRKWTLKEIGTLYGETSLLSYQKLFEE